MSAPSESIQKLNTKLAENYGYLDGVSRNYPRFRVVFSDEQFEKRLGTYRDFGQYGIFLREVREVREVPKYPHLQHMYVLEIAIENVVPDLINKVTYEPYWVFKDLEGNPRSDLVCWRVINLFAALYFDAKSKKGISDYKQDEVDKRNEDIQWYFEQIQDNAPFIAGKLHDGSAIVNPGINN